MLMRQKVCTKIRLQGHLIGNIQKNESDGRDTAPVMDPQWWIQGRYFPPLYLKQTEA